ncbi:MAG: division/cell wall cluster transcriptional repressor MraZ [Bacilli bacterium]|nr:division/cell wall cluster transcriptional repressor MraZ [Bacilli bacterium]
MLIGEYHHNIDEKGRLIIPSKFRDEIGNSFVVTKGLDGCLFVYSLGEWERIVNKLKKLPFTKKDARTFTRFFLAGATVCEFDRQGRINLDNSLILYAGLEKECAIIGVNDRLEIWSLDKLNNLMEENYEKLDEISENLFDGDFDDEA